ncbi:MAG: redox-sensitive transcriptional activator SoxR [Actinomycetota bacterium]
MSDLLSIGAVAERLGVATSTLRFYEAEGLIASTRTDGNQRRFARDVIRRVSFIKAAQQVGLTVDEIGDALGSLPDDRTPTREDWAELSSAWRPRLDEQIAALERLRDKLDGCIGCGCLSLDVCELYNPLDVAAVHGAGAHWLRGLTPPDPFA